MAVHRFQLHVRYAYEFKTWYPSPQSLGVNLD